MKSIMLLAFLCFLFSCKKTEVPPVVIPTTSFDPTVATVLKQGALMGINHTASGTVTVFLYKGGQVVYLNPFSSQDGPDLKVYLSKDEKATDYIRLGPLKSTSGPQPYPVPGNPDISQYHFVHIWCEKYTVVFAEAKIE